MVLLIDNYDSFSYNLYQRIGEIAPDVRVVRNDELTVEDIEELAPDAIIISPGPGRPEDAGVSVEVVRALSGRFPILGVCLGHQAICQAFGADIVHAAELMHGKESDVRITRDAPIFEGLSSPFRAARYHSLAVDPATLPDELEVIAVADDDEVMAVRLADRPVYGMQFHPESIMTPEGQTLLGNFIALSRAQPAC